MPDILNASTSMFASVGTTPFAEVEKRIRKAKTTPEGIEQNLLVARALRSAALSEGIDARQHSFLSMSVGVVDQIRFWGDLYVIMDGKAYITFFDPRRANALNDLARKFVYSLQHEHIRSQDSDFENAGLAVFRFGDDGESRIAKIFIHEGGELFSFEELQTMIADTYRLWIEISEERAEETRRAARPAGGMF